MKYGNGLMLMEPTDHGNMFPNTFYKAGFIK